MSIWWRKSSDSMSHTSTAWHNIISFRITQHMWDSGAMAKIGRVVRGGVRGRQFGVPCWPSPINRQPQPPESHAPACGWMPGLDLLPAMLRLPAPANACGVSEERGATAVLAVRTSLCRAHHSHDARPDCRWKRWPCVDDRP